MCAVSIKIDKWKERARGKGQADISYEMNQVLLRIYIREVLRLIM
jgi:hypothetical protein